MAAKSSADRTALNLPVTMETFLIGLLALACLAYLVFAVLRPEKF